MMPDLNLIAKSLQSLVKNQSISRLNSEAPSSLTGPPNLLNRIRIEKQQPQTESDSSFKIKKKKCDSVLLHEQLKPVLNNLLSVSVNSNIPRDLISINFQFSLRSILFESSRFMSVFEDMPLNLFSNEIKSNSSNNFASALAPRSQLGNKGSLCSRL